MRLSRLARSGQAPAGRGVARNREEDGAVPAELDRPGQGLVRGRDELGRGKAVVRERSDSDRERELACPKLEPEPLADDARRTVGSLGKDEPKVVRASASGQVRRPDLRADRGGEPLKLRVGTPGRAADVRPDEHEAEEVVVPERAAE